MKLFGFNISRSLPQSVNQQANRRNGRHGNTRSLLSMAGMSRLESSWPTQIQRIDAYIFKHWTKIVARCQHETENGDHARKFVSMLKENVVGATGVTLQPQVSRPDGKPDKVICDAIADAFTEWSRKGTCEVTGALSRVDYERLAISAIADTGEFIFQKCYGDGVSPWGFAVKMIDSSRLDPIHCEDRGATFIKHGIEFNRIGQPVAYWFRKDNPAMIHGASAWYGDYDIIPAGDIIHGFIVEKIDQKRGLPHMRTACARLRMLAQFEDAALTNARVSAAKMGFFKAGKEGDEDDIDQDDLITDAEPGVFENIGNRELQSWDPQFPDASVGPFLKSFLQSIASGLNVSYNNLANDLTNVNFSSIRQGAMDEREVWKGLQEWFIGALCWPVFQAWLEYSLLAGRIRVKGRPLPADQIERFASVSFNGRRWGWIDPASEMTANEKALNLKVKSRSQIMRDYGADPWTVWNEISAEREEMESLGIDPAVKVSGDTSPQKPEAADSPATAQDATA